MSPYFLNSPSVARCNRKTGFLSNVLLLPTALFTQREKDKEVIFVGNYCTFNHNAPKNKVFKPYGGFLEVKWRFFNANEGFLYKIIRCIFVMILFSNFTFITLSLLISLLLLNS